MIDIKEFKNKDIVKFVEKLFEARQVSHTYHLKTKSYSEHKALDDFYTDLLKFVDDFVETYQGQYGIIEGIKPSSGNVENIVFYLEDFCKVVKNFRENLKDTHLQNILDEVLSLNYKTLYKLKYLK